MTLEDWVLITRKTLEYVCPDLSGEFMAEDRLRVASTPDSTCLIG
jgi:hypothetical protein